MDKIVQLIVATCRMVVNYNQSINDGVNLVKYGRTNPALKDREDFTDKSFLSTQDGEKEVEFAIFHPNCNIKSDEVWAIMRKEGYRPATIKELLAFGKNASVSELKNEIVALGSVTTPNKIDGFRGVGILSEVCSRKTVGLIHCDTYWHNVYRFLAVRDNQI